MSFCNRILITTEHPKLFIYERTQFNILYDNDIQTKQGILSYDLFTYFNSKFVYVKKHFRVEIKSLYIDILQQKCELERKVLYNSLSLASLSPDEIAYNIMEKPGYIARLAGEAVHIIQCTPTEVQLFHTDKCFSQLPVISSNEIFYLTPKTHILMKTGTEINCNTIISQYYKIGNEWINLIPTPRGTTNAVLTLKPTTKITWKPTELESLATSGIYSQEDLHKLQNHIFLPMEKASLLNLIARSMRGDESVEGGLVSNLILTEQTLTNIAGSTWNKFITKLTKFGSISSAIIMIAIIFQYGKSLINVIIRGYTLHSIYGISAYLLGAIFSSIT
ncbi:uncharacterized protein LOC131663305 isoform X1 [Phymastichus coffea]|uniref:uncharacterized protein LOC131663291 isoform X1 n=1 Tax=Phymastichus coffea TaxID=108790 RepID=UPI00273B7832|nr:uncharacterized protein LOC131663291 isoform X1 [Phymastichus coffea]XP_058789609.1 uncharacterized protein LOC131663291 isoform X1 [Phymastichus coffea]XP_058789630.1 uncharacterized protein LOC131663305 isoform X1 [Phymastichus coffea]